MKKKISAGCITKESNFASPQVKGKLIKNVHQALRGTQKQNAEVIKLLSAELGSVAQRKVPSRQVSMELQNKVKAFYSNDEISRASPNAKDFVRIVIENQSTCVSVKHLLYPIKEIHGMFCRDNANHEDRISLSSFLKLRPKHILSFTKLPHNVCCCQWHENLRCCLKALKSADTAFSDVYVDYNMHKNFTCEEASPDCFFNKCIECQDSKIFKRFIEKTESAAKIVNWQKWIKTSKNQNGDDEHKNQYCNIEKVKKTSSISDLTAELLDQVPFFLDHEFVKLNQSRSFDSMMQRAMENNSEVAVFVCDFAEKYKCIQHNQTQSAHFGQTPITLFTAAVYHRKFMPFVIASDYEKQTKNSVIPFLTMIFDRLPSTVRKVEMWSDNATSQFKNQFIMNSLKAFEDKYEVSIRWNFFAAMHGKSVVDGLGGSAKRFVRRRILADENLKVDCAEQFTEVANQMDIEVLLLPVTEVQSRCNTMGLSTIVEKSKQIPNIKQSHSFALKDVKVGKRSVNKIVCEKITPNLL